MRTSGSAEVAGTLTRVLRRTPALQVVVVPRHPDMDGALTGPAARLGQQQARDALREARGDRVGVYDLQNDEGTPIYVHAKVCVIEDSWFTCGSGDVNRGS